jgi:hypothetical protein
VNLENLGADENVEMMIGECVQYMCDSIPDKLDHHCVAPAALRTILNLDIGFTNPQRFLSKKVAILDCLCSVSAVKVGNRNTLSVLSTNSSHNENSE